MGNQELTIVPTKSGHLIYIDDVYAGRIDSRVTGYGPSRVITWDCENELELSLGWGASVADAVGIVENDFVRRVAEQSDRARRIAEFLAQEEVK
jgi:hypothetical protein